MSSFVPIHKPVKKIRLNPMQMAAIQANHKYKRKYINIKAGRGSGKSTILGWFVKEAVRQMPRATGVLVGETFVQIKARTFPSTKEGMEMFGLFEGVDYVVGKCGQSLGFDMPFQAPNNWSNVVHFSNGHILVLVSLDDPNSGRGLNAYYVIGDEAALFDKERLFNNVQTTNRAKRVEFDKCSLVNAEIFTSTVPLTHKGKWFNDLERISKENPKEYAYIKASALVNRENLEDGWIERIKRNSTSQMLFDAEIMNIDPPAVPDGFYAKLEKSHYYKARYNYSLMGGVTEEYVASCKFDMDLVKGQPIDLSLDFGGRINVGIVSQFLKSINTVNILKDFNAKNPKLLSDLVQQVIDYYAPHKSSCNTINLYHDRSGYKSEANSKTTLAQDVENQLRAAGWRVVNRTPNTNNPHHMAKFRLINAILSEDEQYLPIVRINEDNCPNLIISMENAGLKHKEDAFEKDKSSERSSVILQEHATHLSDAFDYLMWWKFYYLMDYSYHDSVIVSTF